MVYAAIITAVCIVSITWVSIRRQAARKVEIVERTRAKVSEMRQKGRDVTVCSRCGGAGWLVFRDCPKCDARGYVSRSADKREGIR